VSQAEGLDSTFSLVREGVRLANEAYSQVLSAEWEEAIEERTTEIGVAHDRLLSGNLNVVLFHVKIPADAGEIKTPEIRNWDHNKIDYESLIRLNIDIALRTNPRARVFLLTDHTFLGDLKEHDRLKISRLSVNAREPMFERVLTMTAYVRSSLFDAPTVFLDSDAFLIRPIHNLFMNHFDVGLTHRNIVGQMPINEGVIFANNMNHEVVQKIFDSYLASYLAIESDSGISEIYSNLRRWRGGQLSVNSIGQGGQVYASGYSRRSGARIVYLPCAAYNLSQIEDQEVNGNLPLRSVVLHLKGPRKSWIDRVKVMMDLPDLRA